MSLITYRPAKIEDADIIADLSIVAGGGIIEFLLTDVVPGISPKQILSAQIASEDPPFSYRYVTVAEDEGNVIGIIHCYPSEYCMVPDASVIPTDRINYIMAPMFQNPVKDSLYLHALAISPTYHGQYVSVKLWNYTCNMAKNKSFKSVTGHVWRDNKAILLYKLFGAKAIAHLDIKRTPLLPHDGGMILMQKTL